MKYLKEIELILRKNRINFEKKEVIFKKILKKVQLILKIVTMF